MRFEQVARALVQGFSCLDQLDARVGPLFFDLHAVEKGPDWAPLEWPEGARVPALYSLEFEADGRAAGRATLPAEGAVLFGRGARCDVRLGHPSVEKQHARFVVRGGRVYVTDLSDPDRAMAPWGVEMSAGESLRLGRNAVAHLSRLSREEAPLRRFVESMTIGFRRDPGGYRPGSPEDRLGKRPVGSFRARVKGPRGVFEDLLETHYGGGHPYVLRDSAPGIFSFEFGPEAPPPAEPEGHDGPLEAFLRGLPAAVASLETEPDWLAFAGGVPEGTGLIAQTYPRAPVGVEGPLPLLDLEFKPPIDALALARLWALPEAYAVSAGSRLVRWRLATRTPAAPPSGHPASGFGPPSFGPYEVDATLEVRPRGKGGYEGEAYGTGLAYDLRRARGGVRRLSFRRREG